MGGGLRCDPGTAYLECGGDYGVTRGLLTQSGALDELLPLLYPGQAQEERLSLCRASLTLLDLCTEQTHMYITCTSHVKVTIS